MKIPLFFRIIFNRFFFQKAFSLFLFLGILYIFQGFFLMFFMTFLFFFLFSGLSKWIHFYLGNIIKTIRPYSLRKTLAHLFGYNMIVALVYLFFIVLLSVSFSSIVPTIVNEMSQLPSAIPAIGDRLNAISQSLKEISSFQTDLQGTLSQLFTDKNIDMAGKLLTNLKSIGGVVFQFLFSIILSFVCIVDREKISEYFGSIRRGNFAFVYREFQLIFEKINLGFGIIFKAQAIIAVINTALTTLGMFAIGYIYKDLPFPYISTLASIVFICGFIPIVGALLSSLPIILIAYTFGEWHVALACMIMIMGVHAVESYYLNPKLVAAYMHLPVAFTFVILITAEHFFGFVGLLIGTPLFYISIDILKDLDVYINKVRQTYGELHTVQWETKDLIESSIRLSRSGKRGPKGN